MTLDKDDIIDILSNGVDMYFKDKIDHICMTDDPAADYARAMDESDQVYNFIACIDDFLNWGATHE